jgi:hypothetical protein
MKYYSRADGTMARGIQFQGRDKSMEDALWLITFLNDQGFITNWRDAESTDEWVENEDGEPEQVIIPEHLKIIREIGTDEDGNRIELGVDNAYLGDYIVERDGEYYVMNQQIFEAIYEEVKV